MHIDESLLGEYAPIFNRYSNYLKSLGTTQLNTCRSRANLFLRWLVSKRLSLSQLTPHLVNEYLSNRKALGLREETLDGDLSELRQFFDFARREALLSQDPTKDVCCRWLEVPGGYPAYQGVLREALSLPPAALFHYRLPRFAPHWEEFLRKLIDRRYSKPAIWSIARHNRDFHHYLASANVLQVQRIRPAHLNAFIENVRSRYQRKHGRPPSDKFLIEFRGSVELFVKDVFSKRKQMFGRAKIKSRNRVLPDDLLQQYMEFCREHKGLKPQTLESHLNVLTKLRRFLARRSIKSIDAVSIEDYDGFLLGCSKYLKTSSLFLLVGVLRGFLRYLYLQGTLPSDMAQKLMSPCRFSADLRPKYLPWKKIEQFLAGIRRDTLLGKRDFAILNLLAYHGLRAQEVVKLTFSDIDPEAPSLLLRDQKNGSTSRIHLSPQAKEALEHYLTARPDCDRPELFLTARAPMQPLRDLYTLTHRRLAAHFGHPLPAKGPHLLRHSFAKLLLDRKATQQDITYLLRHNSPASAQTYTRIATEDLREVADNYANLFVGRSKSASSATVQP